MSIHWGSLLLVFAVSFGSTVAVVALVTLGLSRDPIEKSPSVPVGRTGLCTNGGD